MDKILSERKKIVYKKNRGEFLKPCPGTSRGYMCCGYQVLTPVTGCGMYCNYCILQEYFEEQGQVIYENFDDLEKEVKEKLDSYKGVARIGTGEFADSLYLEPSEGISKKIADLLEPYENVLVEFKTKSVNIDSLSSIKNKRKVIIGFSMNPSEMIELYERDTASLEKRLEAAAKCEKMGFWVAFHFDPVIWHRGWEKSYKELVDRIFSAIKDPAKIAWWSIGSFRTMPSLKKLLREKDMHLPLFSGEMVLGEDRKLRYFRPLREHIYTVIRKRVEEYYPGVTLYFCMESREVWKNCGMIKRIHGGLKRYLDERAEQMLGL